MELDPSLAWRTVLGPGFNDHVGPVRLARVGETEWRAALLLDDRHVNAGGVTHGGVLLTLADIAMGAATYEAGPHHPCATIELSSRFLAAAKPGQTLLAEVRQLRRVRELSFMECEIRAGGRQVLAAGGIWKYLASRGPGQGWREA